MLTTTKILAPVLVAASLSLSPSHARRDFPTPNPVPPARRSMAVNLIRGINTAEYVYKERHGGFADRTNLLISDEFRDPGMRFAALNDSQLADISISDKPEILPGWNLRLNLIKNGIGYDLQLEDTADKTGCHYAALSDERGLIRESCTI